MEWSKREPQSGGKMCHKSIKTLKALVLERQAMENSYKSETETLEQDKRKEHADKSNKSLKLPLHTHLHSEAHSELYERA